MKSRRQSISGGGGGGGGGEGNTKITGGGKMERKDVEKNRRLHMKGLCLKLSALLPTTSGAGHHHLRHATSNGGGGSSSPPSNTNKDAITQMDQLDCAAAYIKQLKGRIDELKRRKQGAGVAVAAGTRASGSSSGGEGGSAVLPVVEVRCQEAALDVVLVSEAGKPFKLHEVITAVEQEGAEVVTASFSVVGDKIFYTVHSQALRSGIGLDASRISRRLKGLACAVAATTTAAAVAIDRPSPLF